MLFRLVSFILLLLASPSLAAKDVKFPGLRQTTRNQPGIWGPDCFTTFQRVKFFDIRQFKRATQLATRVAYKEILKDTFHYSSCDPIYNNDGQLPTSFLSESCPVYSGVATNMKLALKQLNAHMYRKNYAYLSGIDSCYRMHWVAYE